MAQSTHSSEGQRRGRDTGRNVQREQATDRQDHEQEQDRSSGGQRAGGGAPQTSIVNMSAIAARGLGQIYDMQLAAARMMLQTQARAAAAFGIPDYSNLFRVGDDRARRVFSSSTDQLVETQQRTSQTLSEIQHHMGRMFECNAVTLSETWRSGLEEFASQAEEGLEQLQELARKQADEAVRAAESLSEATRESIRQGGDEMRETMRQGMERGRELAGEQSEAVRAEGERATGQAREEQQDERGRRTRAA